MEELPSGEPAFLGQAAVWAYNGGMSANTPHARLLNEAALSVLEPLGLAQVGRSRTWVDDHDWWLVLVEFQPDNSSRGSYLNVGAMWLWHEIDHWSFDVGYRVGDFKTFRNKAQFEREATDLATRAGQQVEKYRRLFASIETAADYLVCHCDGGSPWGRYHAGVACGLTGRVAESSRWIDQFLEQARRAGWSAPLLRCPERLRTFIGSTAGFRLAIEQTVATTRAALRLSQVEGAIEWGVECGKQGV
jgi:hypothetical protein